MNKYLYINGLKMSEETMIVEKNKESWMNSKWRPMMGWMYMLVCIMDFVGFPILWSLLQAYADGQVTSQWQPLTLQGAGLFHIAMGAVLGITAYGRTKEKIAGAENSGLEGFGQGSGTTYIPPGQGNAQVSNQPIMNNRYGSTPQRTMYAPRSGPPPQIDRPL